MKKYPFKFLDAYDKEDKDVFFGREEETEELYRLVFLTNLLLVYGASGTGKTSLIRCGLANRFESSQWLDLYIRRGDDINQSLLDTILNNTPKAAVAPQEEELDWFESMMEVEEEIETPAAPLTGLQTDNPVAQALHQLYLAAFTPIYLIFDQFEELYTLGESAEQNRLIETIKELVQLPVPLKIIIVMREEYLARIYELEKAVPQLRDKKLRLEPMNLPRVEQVILKATARNPQSNIELEAGEEKTIAKAIVEKIREGDVNIKLPYLQVFMDRLYETATGEAVNRRQDALFTLKLVNQMGDIGDVLTEFIDRQSRRIRDKLAQKHQGLPSDLVWQFLSPFATVDGTKAPIKQSELAGLWSSLNLPDVRRPDDFIKEIVAELENSRILRYRKEERAYEVAHDTLARQIAEKRSEEEKAYLKAKRMVIEGHATYRDVRTFLNREQLGFIKAYEERLEKEITAEQQNFIRDSKNKRLRRRVLGWTTAAAFAVAVWATFTIVKKQQQTRQALTEQTEMEKNELRSLLRSASQIAVRDNCPPQDMRLAMDSLYQKHQTDTDLREQYETTIAKLNHCN